MSWVMRFFFYFLSVFLSIFDSFVLVNWFVWVCLDCVVYRLCDLIIMCVLFFIVLWYVWILLWIICFFMNSFDVYMLIVSESNVCKMVDIELNLCDFCFIFGLLVIFVWLLYWCGIYWFFVFKNFGIFGFELWLFLGSIFEVYKFGGLYVMLLENMKCYGKIFVVCLGWLFIIVIIELEVLKIILVKEFISFRNWLDEVKFFFFFNCGFLVVRDE